jgi:PAS domain S-box-containing protein
VVDVPPWPAVVTLGAGVANLVLLRYLWPYRREPGGRWFLVVIAIQVFWCLTYGVALFVFDPTLRLALEVLTWIPVNWIGIFFLGFALTYTGRVDLVHSPGFYAAVVFEAVSTVLVLTNPWHHLVWSDFAVDPVFGAATVTYTHHAWVFVQYLGVFALGAVGTLVLLDTVVSYGPLFRKQALALALTPIPPAIAFTAWAFELGPYPQLNLTAAMFLPHVLLDMYALFGSTMFEFKPATRRTGERAAIDDIGTAVAMVDREARIITLNAAAEALFGVDKRGVLADPLSSLFSGDAVDLEAGEQALTLQIAGRRREFDVAVTPLVDPADTHVGYTVVFQDVTDERQRKQRLEVLNRILRHNLRNDLNVVINYADLIATKGSEDTAGYADRIESQSQSLVSLGEKARRTTQALDGDLDTYEFDLAEAMAAVTEDCRESHAGTVTVDVPADVTVDSDHEVLTLVVESLVENGLVHGGEDPTVEVAYDGTGEDDSVVLTVSDDGPGIPDHELSVLEAGEESALEHGSGMGLWAVVWGMTALGGEVTFERPDDGGTVVRLRVPGLVADRSG